MSVEPMVGLLRPALSLCCPCLPVKPKVLSLHATDENRFGSGSAQCRPRSLPGRDCNRD